MGPKFIHFLSCESFSHLPPQVGWVYPKSLYPDYPGTISNRHKIFQIQISRPYAILTNSTRLRTNLPDLTQFNQVRLNLIQLDVKGHGTNWTDSREMYSFRLVNEPTRPEPASLTQHFSIRLWHSTWVDTHRLYLIPQGKVPVRYGPTIIYTNSRTYCA